MSLQRISPASPTTKPDKNPAATSEKLLSRIPSRQDWGIARAVVAEKDITDYDKEGLLDEKRKAT